MAAGDRTVEPEGAGAKGREVFGNAASAYLVAPAETMPIGRLICFTRRGQGLTQYQLADELVAVSGNDSLKRDQVSRWERGKRVPGPYWQGWLSAVLDIPAERLRAAARRSKELRGLAHAAVSEDGEENW
jgi:transcriptional regulator with XRE-family HTH domain